MLRNKNKRITYSTLSNKQANDGKLKFKDDFKDGNLFALQDEI
jgi:hypothetical protein